MPLNVGGLRDRAVGVHASRQRTRQFCRRIGCLHKLDAPSPAAANVLLSRTVPDTRRRRLLASGSLAILVTAVVVLILGRTGDGSGPTRTPRAARVSASPRVVPPRSRPRPSSFAVGLRVLRLLDSSRTIRLPDGTTAPRTLVTYVRYPALGAAGATDVRDAPAARADGSFPLVIFGHGFAVTPKPYVRLLQAWARAGYVVAAPVFPLGNADAPGGPNESDLINQPADMRVAISRLLAASGAASGPLAGLIDPARVAVSGQSDGGDTALAVAYDARFRDPRVGAAIILSGAEIPGTEGFAFPAGGPPLLATQGTADTVNLPSATQLFFDAAPRPKYLLSLLGAEHLPPYTGQQPQLGIVERASIAFLDGFLRRRPGALGRLVTAANVSGVASLLVER
jgi:dienelactone hydrolase